jgi:two-component system, NtrC family, response regulator HydG
VKNVSILIIDDDRDVLDALGVLLEDDFSRIVKESNVNRIPSLLGEAFDLVLLDMNFSAGINSGNEGLFWLSKIKQLNPAAEVIMMTAYGNIALAVEAIKRGAKDFVLKPWDNGKLLATIKSVLGSDERKKADRVAPASGLFIEGKSPVMRTIQDQLLKVAATDASVLLLGESGTGKEVFARRIHEMSNRKDHLFNTVDLSAIPTSLFESELFGHKKGAFTDAKTDREGKLLAANHGTLFLDEIGNLPVAQQVKLLTVLQNRSVTPLGDTHSRKVDVRLISATNENLAENVLAGKFRQDLLYRINTISITIPPLRDRQEDIKIFAEAFLHVYKQRYNKHSMRFSPSALASMSDYNWPGNIRELKHTIEKTVILADTDLIDAKDLDLSISGKLASGSVKRLDEIEKEAMINALSTHGGNIVHAAKALGITRQTLYNKMKKYGI